jgi:ATP adenylyltransferase
MDQIWSPWRMEYIASPKSEGCVFCAKLAPGSEAAEYILLQGRTAYVTLNRYPYNNGHLLVVPYAHVPSLENLAAESLAEMMLLVNQGLATLRLAMKPDGFNIGVNLGKAAGAGIESHVHIHVVPRWYGDTSFMSVVGETRTIPETLDRTYQRLQAALHGLQAPLKGEN